MPHRISEVFSKLESIIIMIAYSIVGHIEVSAASYVLYSIWVTAHCVTGGMIIWKFKPSEYKVKINLTKFFYNYIKIFLAYLVAAALVLRLVETGASLKEVSDEFFFISTKGINILTLMFIISTLRHIYKIRTGIDLPDKDYLSLAFKSLYKASTWILENTIGKLETWGGCKIEELKSKNKEDEEETKREKDDSDA